MPTNYCIRLYRLDPRVNATLASGSPQLNDVYGPASCLVGWLGNFAYGNSDFSEQLTSMSDPNGQQQVSNVNPISFRVGNIGASDVDVTFIGLVAASSQGGDRNSFAANATPVSVLPLPGGRKRVPGTGRLDFGAGALVFQL